MNDPGPDHDRCAAETRDMPEQRPEPAPGQAPEQARYARWLGMGTRVGLVFVALGFAGHVTGAWPSQVSPSDLTAFWGQPASVLTAHRAGLPAAAGWPPADTMAWWGIAGLATVSVPALLAQLPSAWRRGDRAFAGLCAVAAGIIMMAAAGLGVG